MLSGLSSAQRLALLSATREKSGLSTTEGYRNMTTTPPLHAGVNVLLGGAMMSGMLLLVVCVCYCCHRRVNKPDYEPEQWIQVPEETDSTLQIFTLEQQCFEIAAEVERSRTPSPPPAYDEVVSSQSKKDDQSPPSYDSAVKLAACGYV
ncbi:hypothetical protein LSTR_LSTR000332 [Laodelphax striatellus]|uniref:Uncharacterized protein n=1 Tax=Laodelphax striatellus TaxID=195883 RepID=A0A482X818_LAOST|nr:hypothetical protein LSTR_LSTR000332 [Laodelphax striatellus]